MYMTCQLCGSRIGYDGTKWTTCVHAEEWKNEKDQKKKDELLRKIGENK